MSSLCEDIKLHTSKLLVCNETNLGTEISTPLSYPDGEAVTVFAFVKGNSVTLHDGGMAAYSLGKSGQSFTKKIAQRADYFAKLYGCEVRNQRVHRSCDLHQMTAAIYTVASVCSFIGSHLAFDETVRSDFEAKVLLTLGKDFPQERINLKPQYVGDTGKVYGATASIIDKKTGLDLAVIEAVSSSRAVNSKFRAFYDIRNNPLYSGVVRLSVFDDREEFSEGDIPLLQDVSNAVPFSSFENRIMEYV